VGIYKSLTDTGMKELGTRPRSFISEKMWANFLYSVFAVHRKKKDERVGSYWRLVRGDVYKKSYIIAW
jgi:hypothetical protein